MKVEWDVEGHLDQVLREPVHLPFLFRGPSPVQVGALPREAAKPSSAPDIMQQPVPLLSQGPFLCLPQYCFCS